MHKLHITLFSIKEWETLPQSKPICFLRNVNDVKFSIKKKPPSPPSARRHLHSPKLAKERGKRKRKIIRRLVSWKVLQNCFLSESHSIEQTTYTPPFALCRCEISFSLTSYSEDCNTLTFSRDHFHHGNSYDNFSASYTHYVKVTLTSLSCAPLLVFSVRDFSNISKYLLPPHTTNHCLIPWNNLLNHRVTDRHWFWLYPVLSNSSVSLFFCNGLSLNVVNVSFIYTIWSFFFSFQKNLLSYPSSNPNLSFTA